MNLRGPFRSVLAAACMLLATSAALAAPPATQPDLPESLTDAQMQQLAVVGDRLRDFVWGEPVVEDFVGRNDHKPWFVQADARIVQRDDGMLLHPAQGDTRFGAIARPLPEKLVGQIGGRIDLWLTVPKVQQSSRLILFLHGDKPTEVKWDRAYYFAYGREGAQQRFARWQRRGAFSAHGWNGDAMKAERLVHVMMQFSSGRVAVQRDNDRKYELRVNEIVPMAAKTHLGLAAYRCEARVLRMSYRPLIRGGDPDDPAVWRDSPFAGRQQFQAWLRVKAVPMLTDPSWQKRQGATRLLSAVAPLAHTELRKALAEARNPEARLRLQSIVDRPIDAPLPDLDETKLNPPTVPRPNDNAAE